MSRQQRVAAIAWWLLGGKLDPTVGKRPVDDAEMAEAKNLAALAHFANNPTRQGRRFRQVAITAATLKKMTREGADTIATVGRLLQSLEAAGNPPAA